jgi:hypothetical protein
LTIALAKIDYLSASAGVASGCGGRQWGREHMKR